MSCSLDFFLQLRYIAFDWTNTILKCCILDHVDHIYNIFAEECCDRQYQKFSLSLERRLWFLRCCCGDLILFPLLRLQWHQLCSSRAWIRLNVIRSKTFPIIDSNEMGLKFDGSSLFPFLKNGITENFQILWVLSKFYASVKNKL